MTLQIIRTLHPPEPIINQLADLHTRAGFPATPDDIRRRTTSLPDEDRLLLAIDGDKLMGYAQMHLSRNLMHDETIDIVAVLVRSDFRRRGIGRRLIAAAEAWARDTKRGRLRLCANVLAKDLHAFFIALHYHETGTLVEFVEPLQPANPGE